MGCTQASADSAKKPTNVNATVAIQQPNVSVPELQKSPKLGPDEICKAVSQSQVKSQRGGKTPKKSVSPNPEENTKEKGQIASVINERYSKDKSITQSSVKKSVLLNRDNNGLSLSPSKVSLKLTEPDGSLARKSIPHALIKSTQPSNLNQHTSTQQPHTKRHKKRSVKKTSRSTDPKVHQLIKIYAYD